MGVETTCKSTLESQCQGSGEELIELLEVKILEEELRFGMLISIVILHVRLCLCATTLHYSVDHKAEMTQEATGIMYDYAPEVRRWNLGGDVG